MGPASSDLLELRVEVPAADRVVSGPRAHAHEQMPRSAVQQLHCGREGARKVSMRGRKNKENEAIFYDTAFLYTVR